MQAPDQAAGKKAKCPKCGSVIPVPTIAEEFEVIDEEPKPAKKAVRIKAVSAKPVDDDEDEGYERRSRKRRDADEDEDYRPRRGKKPVKKSGGIPIWIPIVGGGVFLLLIAVVGVGLVLILGNHGGVLPSTSSTSPTAPKLAPPPPGYTSISEAGICVYLHGNVSGHMLGADQYTVRGTNWNETDHMSEMYAQRTPEFRPSPANKSNVRSAYERASFLTKIRKHTIVSEEEITIGGQPGVVLILKEIPDVWEQDEQQKKFFKNANDRERDRVAKEGKVSAFIYVVNGDWSYCIAVTNKLKDIDPAKIKIITDSVKFY
jgi:hypothetical protein